MSRSTPTSQTKQYLSSQNVSFYISLTRMHPIHSIKELSIFLSLFCQKNCRYELIFKYYQNFRCLFLFEKRAALNLTTNLFPTTKLIQTQDSPTRKLAVFSYTMKQYP